MIDYNIMKLVETISIEENLMLTKHEVRLISVYVMNTRYSVKDSNLSNEDYVHGILEYMDDNEINAYDLSDVKNENLDVFKYLTIGERKDWEN